MTHAARIIDLSASFTGAMARFVARIEGASPEALEKVPADGGWTAAQIAWHVAATNEAFAGLIDGSIPHARPATETFRETPWSAIAEKVPAKLDAPQQFHPPATVGAREVLERLRASQGKVTTALAGGAFDYAYEPIDPDDIARRVLGVRRAIQKALDPVAGGNPEGGKRQ